jgi:hypothetical protein
MWEYLVVFIIGKTYFKTLARGREGTSIDELGAEGWELVAITQQGDNHIAYFKRQAK